MIILLHVIDFSGHDRSNNSLDLELEPDLGGAAAAVSREQLDVAAEAQIAWPQNNEQSPELRGKLLVRFNLM